MKPRMTQLGARKNPDSPRVHGLRLAVNPSLERRFGHKHDQDEASAQPLSVTTSLQSPLANESDGATVGKGANAERLLSVEEVAALLHVPVSWVYGRTRKRSSERLPGYRLGKYWRFREAEILAWLKSQDERARAI